MLRLVTISCQAQVHYSANGKKCHARQYAKPTGLDSRHYPILDCPFQFVVFIDNLNYGFSGIIPSFLIASSLAFCAALLAVNDRASARILFCSVIMRWSRSFSSGESMCGFLVMVIQAVSCHVIDFSGLVFVVCHHSESPSNRYLSIDTMLC